MLVGQSNNGAEFRRPLMSTPPIFMVRARMLQRLESFSVRCNVDVAQKITLAIDIPTKSPIPHTGPSSARVMGA
jgi:hypothetical protein